MFSKLTEEEQAEAKRFGELITNLGYEEFEKFKKENPGRGKLLFNWCRISKNFLELHKKRKEFIEIDVALNQAEYENKIKGKMSSGKQKFIEEHLIDQYSINSVKYRIFRQFSTSAWNDKDEYLVIGIPYIATGFYGTKFGQGIEIKKSLNPTYFEWILNNIPKYDGTNEVASNNPKFNKSAF